VEVATNYHPTDEREIPHVDITRDVNGDGRDDLVGPNADGFWIVTQCRDGSFSDPVKLGPPEPFRGQIAVEDQRSYVANGKLNRPSASRCEFQPASRPASLSG
jgi:hypothetical protein